MAKNFRLDVTKAMAASTTSMRSGSATTYQSASFITAESGSAVNLHSPILIPAATASAFPTPDVGTGSLYVSSVDYKLYFQDSYGAEYDLTIGSTPGGELTASNLMIDGSTSGSINFVNDGVIYIKDNDTSALRIQEATNAYMTFVTTNSDEKVVIAKDVQFVSTDAGAGGAPNLDFFRNSSSPAADDVMGKIAFTGKDDGGAIHEYAAIQSEINDAGAGGEDGVLIFNILKNASTKSALELKNNEAVFNNGGQDIDFRIESDDETHMLFIDGNANRVSIGDSADAPAATLEITNHASAGAFGVPLLQLNSNDTNEYAVDINAANIDETVIHITADALTDSFVMDVSADALTDGGILNLVSDSSDTSARTLVAVKNDNTAAVGTVVMHLINDAIGGYDDPILLIESTAAETHPVLELKNSNASTTAEPILMLTRADNSAEADDMSLGQIQFRGVDSANANEYYCQIKAFATDVTATDEGGKMNFICKAGGTAGTAGNMVLLSLGGEDVANSTPCEVIVNESGIDCDFRVESDDNTHMLFVDAGDDTVTIGADDALHKQGFATINDFNGTTFESQLADGEYGSADILRYSPGANDTLTAGQIYFLHTDGTWDATDADAVATGASQMLGVGLGGASQTVGVLTKGFIKIPSTEILNLPGSGACDGLPVYVSTTAGHFDFTAPSATNDFVRIVGYAIDDDSSDVLVYFDPDKTHVVIA